MNPRPTLGSVSSAPHSPHTPEGRDQEIDPYMAIHDPELRLAVMHAHRLWAITHAPWLLERWLDD